MDTQKVNDPFPLLKGTYEDALKMIGKPGKLTFAEFTVNQDMIKNYCAMVEDKNLSYWDEAYSKKQWGGLVAPPGMLLAWPMALVWRPDKVRDHYFISINVPFPGTTLINVGTESEFLKPVYVGDNLNVYDELVSISQEKKTRLGTGHFLKTRATFRNQKGEVVAVRINNMFRYTPAEE